MIFIIERENSPSKDAIVCWMSIILEDSNVRLIRFVHICLVLLDCENNYTIIMTWWTYIGGRTSSEGWHVERAGVFPEFFYNHKPCHTQTTRVQNVYVVTSLFKQIHPSTSTTESCGHVLNQPCSESVLITLHSMRMTTDTTNYIILLCLRLNNVRNYNRVPNLNDTSLGLSHGVP